MTIRHFSLKVFVLLGAAAILGLNLCCQRADRDFPPDVSNIAVDFDIIRVDQIMDKMDSSNVSAMFDSLASTYPGFTDLYFTRIIPFEGYENGALRDKTALLDMNNNSGISAIQDSVNKSFPPNAETLSAWHSAFREVFQYYRHYFPDRETPDIYTFISEFGFAAFIFEEADGGDAVGIGLDMFLGPEFPYEQLSTFSNAFSAYLTRTYNKDHLVKKATDAVIEDLVAPPRSATMIDHLIYEGKKQYLRKLFLPTHHDSVVWEMPPEKVRWMRENEANIWFFMVDKELLYSNRQAEYIRLLRPAPHSVGMPPEAPGRAIVYVGKAIVESMMENNPDLGIIEMLSITDGQQFLQQSSYRPPR